MVSEGEWTPRQAVFFRFPIWGLLLVFLTAFFVSGCSPRKVSKTKIVKPTNQGDAQNEEPPKSLDREAILAALRERQTTDLRTLKANASCVIEDLNTEERERVTSTFIAEPPHALLFRASKPGTIGEVFRLLQLDETLTLFLDGEAFTGPVESMHPSVRQFIRQEPMILLQAISAYDELVRLAPEGDWSRRSQNVIRFVGPTDYPGIKEALFDLSYPDLELLRIYLYKQPGQKEIEATITYEGWEEVDGINLPKEIMVSVPRDRAVVQLQNIRYQTNLSLPARAFLIPPDMPVYPLAALEFVEKGKDEANQDE
jgi:hypothetical protein